jgi:ATPase subunit of ABC transporter with duplicated ATPase domains
MSRQAVLGIDDGAFFHGARRVFSGISFLLDDAKTALVGENGVGKSTLLGCLSGELELNSGRLSAQGVFESAPCRKRFRSHFPLSPYGRFWSALWSGSAP